MDGARGMRHGVLNQVREHALDQSLVAGEDRSVISDRYEHRRLLLLESVIPFVDELREERTGRHWREGERDVRFLDPGNLENVIDEREQILRLGLHITN